MTALRVRDVELDRPRVEVAGSMVEVLGTLHRDSPKSHRHRSVAVPQFLVPRLTQLVEGRGQMTLSAEYRP